jgi:hypothetical protein
MRRIVQECVLTRQSGFLDLDSGMADRRVEEPVRNQVLAQLNDLPFPILG